MQAVSGLRLTKPPHLLSLRLLPLTWALTAWNWPLAQTEGPQPELKGQRRYRSYLFPRGYQLTLTCIARSASNECRLSYGRSTFGATKRAIRPHVEQIRSPEGRCSHSTEPQRHGLGSGASLEAHIGLPDATAALDGPDPSLSIVFSLEGRVARLTHHTEAVPLRDFVKIRHLHHLRSRHGDNFLTGRDDLPAR